MKQEPDVSCYISFSRSDGQRYASPLANHLRGLGVSVVLQIGGSSASPLADRWRAIDHADVLIVVCTPKALTSDLVLAEVAYFASRRSSVIPIAFPGVTRPGDITRLLGDFQWLFEKSSALQNGPSNEALRHLASLFERLRPAGLQERTEERPVPQLIPRAEKGPLNEGKLILVGRGEVGKTSLVRRVVSDEFHGNESKTQGINITRWDLPLGDDTVRLNVWDFGGQEIMHATHQFFLTQQSLYLLVLNGREGGEDIDAEYWLKHVESFGGESPVIVVQNKIGQHPFDLNYRDLQARYPQIRGFVKTDCRDGAGVEELRTRIESIVGAMPEVRMQFPSNWFRVKERLEDMDEEFLGYQKFVELCAAEGVADDTDSDTLAFVLHCLGIALNYRDDSRLRETSVLKPEWVTHGIYALLNAKRLAERQGELHLSDLRELLPRDRYPLDKHLFLVELMRKFSLCFPFPDETDRYLVPELLGKEEPEEVASFSPERCLNFEYHYGVLPDGLLPRFIVRTHALSRGQQRWRSGVILAYEDCRALVKAVPLDQRVVVRVKGGDRNARRNLLAIVRSDLDRIHAEFKDRLEAQAKVPLPEAPAVAIDYQKLVAFERKGVKDFPEFVGDEVVTVRVDELLNGVAFAAERDDSLATLERAQPLFFSYSHKDETLRDELETHLKLLQRQRIIATWHDRKLLPGSEWDGEIDARLERATIILLLISADFIASDYCWDKEVKRAMERHAAGEAKVIPVLLRSCDWQSAPFGQLEGLPKDMRAVTAWPDRDAAWTAVAAGIRKVAESLPRRGLVVR
jgi:internalin A